MDLTSLRYFVALARNLHFTKTAQELYISQQNCARSTFLAKILNIFGKIFWENGSLK